MCKVMFLSGINSDNRELALQFTYGMAQVMTAGNTDGLGYAAFSEDGSHFGERWHNNHEAFKTRENDVMTSFEISSIKQSKGAWSSKKRPIRYDKVGTIQLERIVAITLHTRFATSGKEFENTHPFWHNGVSLVHNGVISNTKRIGTINSTCDSESILKLYTENNVRTNPRNIEKVASRLDGYYAVGVLSSDKKGHKYLDVFKEERSNLSVISTDILGDIYATREDDVRKVIEEMNKINQGNHPPVNILGVFVVNPGKLIRHDAMSGRIKLVQDFNTEYQFEEYNTYPQRNYLDKPIGSRLDKIDDKLLSRVLNND